jgi:hypothetical protein
MNLRSQPLLEQILPLRHEFRILLVDIVEKGGGLLVAISFRIRRILPGRFQPWLAWWTTLMRS